MDEILLKQHILNKFNSKGIKYILMTEIQNDSFNMLISLEKNFDSKILNFQINDEVNVTIKSSNLNRDIVDFLDANEIGNCDHPLFMKAKLKRLEEQLKNMTKENKELQRALEIEKRKNVEKFIESSTDQSNDILNDLINENLDKKHNECMNESEHEKEESNKGSDKESDKESGKESDKESEKESKNESEKESEKNEDECAENEIDPAEKYLIDFCMENKLKRLKDGIYYRSKTYVIFYRKEETIDNLLRYVDYQISNKHEIQIDLSDEYFYILKVRYFKRPKITLKKFIPTFLNSNIYVAYVCKHHKKDFINRFKPLLSYPLDSTISELMGRLLTYEATEQDITALEYLLSKNISDGYLSFINESNFSSLVNMVIRGYSKYNNNINSKVYSFEKNMWMGNIRRCDGIYLHNDLLIIMEFKNNVYKVENPITYMEDRNYISHVLAYFKIYESEIFQKICKVSQIGMECFGSDKNFQVKITKSDLHDVDTFENEINEKINAHDKKRKRKRVRTKNSRITKKRRIFFPMKNVSEFVIDN